MDALREQFEAWLNVTSERYIISNSELYWQAYQAGHAVNADLLEACDTAKIAIKFALHEVYVHPEIKVMLNQALSECIAAIKKARGE